MLALLGGLVAIGASLTFAQAAQAKAPAYRTALRSDGAVRSLLASGQITGTVTVATSKVALPGVEVCAFPGVEELGEEFGELCTVTNVDGEYAVSGLPAGEYTVKFYAFLGNYVTQYYDDKAWFTEATKVPVTEGGVVAGIDAAMKSGGEIAGTVTAAGGGGALEGIKVCAALSGDEFVVQCTSTNANGEYTISKQAEGEYVVEFYSPSGSYATQYYDDKASFDEATKVPVTKDEVTPPINAEMVAGGQISGMVTAAGSGTPVEDIKVCANKGVVPVQCAITNSSGEYTILRLAEGEYVVEFYAPSGGYATQYYDDKSSPLTATKVPVKEGQVTSGIDASMASGGQIGGEVTAAASGEALEDINVCAIERGGEFVVECASTSSSGEYAIPRLPAGAYTVEFSSLSDSYATQYYYDTSSLVEAKKVLVLDGSTTSGIDAAMQQTGEAATKPVNIEAPQVSGTAAVGATLSCTTGSWSGSPVQTFSYQWWREGTAITGAIASSYKVQSVDQGHALVCEVTASNEAGETGAQSAPVDIPPEATPANTQTGSTGGSTGGSGSVSVQSFVARKSASAVVSVTGPITTKSGAVFVPLHCSATTGDCPAATIQLTVVEEVRGGQVTAVMAAHKGKTTKRTVVIAQVSVTLSAGQSDTVKVALNSPGKKLLAKHTKLAARIEVEVEDTSLKTQDVTIAQPAKKKQTKH